jgi:membrane protein DedA with SNARE-associated domain
VSVPVQDLIFWLLKPFGVLVAAGFGLHPIPEEVIVTYAGVDTGTETRFGDYRWLMLPACMLGSVIADVMLYCVGRFFGARLLEHRWLARLAPPEKRERTRQNFHNYGVLILVFGRLVPGIRTTLFLTSGMMRLPLTRFLLADGLGALLGNTAFFMLGYWMGSQFAELIHNIEHKLSVGKPLILLLLALAVVGYVVYLFVRRPIPTGDPEELPLIGHQVATHVSTKIIPPDNTKATPAPLPNPGNEKSGAE